MTSTIGSALLPVTNCDPGRLLQGTDFTYVDIAAVNVDTKSVANPKRVAASEAPSRARQVIHSGDVLVSTVRPNLNAVAHIPPALDGAIASTGFCVLRPDPTKLDSRYLFHWVKSSAFVSEMVRLATGASYPAVTDRIVKSSYFPAPSIKDQRRIAATLDKAEDLRAKRRAALALLDRLPQAIFLAMFGDVATNSMNWPVVAVGEVTKCIVPGRDKPKSFTGSIPWVTTGDLVQLGHTFGSKSGLGLSHPEISQVRAKVIPARSVILSCVGDLGVLSIAAVPLVVNQQLHVFLCTEKLSSEFLMHSLSFQKRHMYAMASSTTLPYMNKAVCNGIPTILPPIERQRVFSALVDSIDRAKAAQRSALREADALLSSLQASAFCQRKPTHRSAQVRGSATKP